MPTLLRKFVVLLSFLLWPTLATAQTLHIAAASDLSHCLEELNTAFQRNAPDALLKVSFGSSGNFFAQIKNSAPFDLFLSADLGYPRALIRDGLAEESSLTPYAAGRIVVWSMNPAIDLSRGMASLADPALRRIAIANPDHAPYGRAAQAALRGAGLWDKLEARLVKGENIAQTAQFVETGNADAGIVALSLLKAPNMAGKGKYFEIPAELYPRMDQGAVVTRKGAGNPLAARYLAFLRSPQARAIFEKYGFILPDK